MHMIVRSLAAASFAALAAQFAIPAAQATDVTWMRDKVRQAEIAHMERVIGKKAVQQLLANPEIVGGTVAPDGKWKAQVALVNASVPNNASAQFCGGSLIATQFVLTAAHCVDFLTSPSQIRILTGTQSLTSGGTRRTVQRIRIHPKWNNSTFDYDVAVIKLKQPVTGIPVNQLVSKTNEPTFAPNKMQTFVTGWGHTTQGGSGSTALREVKVPIVSRGICNKPVSYNGDITNRMICAGFKAGGKDACQGDSGGPQVVKNAKGKWRLQAGIVSWGVGCAQPNLYGVYSRVAVLNGWIKNQLTK